MKSLDLSDNFWPNAWRRFALNLRVWGLDRVHINCFFPHHITPCYALKASQGPLFRGPAEVYFTELAYDLHHKHPQKDFSTVKQTWGALAGGAAVLQLDPIVMGLSENGV